MTIEQLEQKISSLESQLNDLRERTDKAVNYVDDVTYELSDEEREAEFDAWVITMCKTFNMPIITEKYRKILNSISQTL